MKRSGRQITIPDLPNDDLICCPRDVNPEAANAVRSAQGFAAICYGAIFIFSVLTRRAGPELSRLYGAILSF